MPVHYDLGDKVAIVTGAGRGIGRVIALGLAKNGARVVLSSRTLTELESVQDEIREMGGEALCVQTDLMDSQNIEQLVATAVDTFGRLDILVNNAAKSYMVPLMDLREDGWDKVFDTNLKAVWLLSRAAAKVMGKQGGGRIVNISTVGAVRGGAGMGAYHISKAALNMLTKCLAVEWAYLNINVNAVGPGLTRTSFSEPIWSHPEIEQIAASKIPKGRLAQPEEIVGAVLFLCSGDSGYITGETLYVDGGTLANV